MPNTILIIVISLGSTLSIVLFFVYIRYRIKISRVEHERHRLSTLNTKYNNIFRNRIMSIDFNEEIKDESIKTNHITNAEKV